MWSSRALRRCPWLAALVLVAAIIFFVGLAEARGDAQTFVDVQPSDRFSDAVEALASLRALPALPGPGFGPYEPESRAEFAYSVAALLHLEPVYAVPFSDVAPSDWFAGAVGALYQAGLVQGSPDGRFNPSAELSRQQAATLVVRAYNYRSGGARSGAQSPGSVLPGESAALLAGEGDVDTWLAGFKDRAVIAPEHRAAVAEAYRLGVVSGFDDGRFYPFLDLTRAQAAVILYRSLLLTPTLREQAPQAVPGEAAYPTARVGTYGPLVGWMERRLAKLSYQPGPDDGLFDQRTAEAVMAFQKMEGLERTGSAGMDIWVRVLSAERPTPRKYAPGSRVEVDLTRQVLLYVVDHTVESTIPVASGRSGWRTPTGTFSAERKLPYWRQSALGLLYKPVYFRGGYAIHGSYSVPPYPASHGCVRVSVATMDALYPVIPIGMRVDIYY